ncbi:MAG: histidine phosphatase family protein [Gemmatimonadales bacterium]|nr:histidine phosphatase family protein [Gemmatimonadales bacterium]
MLLLLLRHADAGDADAERWPDDRARPLTPKGHKQVAKVAKALLAAETVPELVLTSPWTRARQTADLLVSALDLAQGSVEFPPLAAPPDAERVLGGLLSHAGHPCLALVGHTPWIGGLASQLLAGDADSVRIDFPKAGVLGLEMPTPKAGSAVLRFLLRPKLL